MAGLLGIQGERVAETPFHGVNATVNQRMNQVAQKVRLDRIHFSVVRKLGFQRPQFDAALFHFGQ